MNVLIFNKTMEVVVDKFCRYAVIIPQVLEQRLFELCRNNDYIVLVWFNKAPWWSYEHAFLDDDTVSWISWVRDHVSYLICFLQDNPTVFFITTVACKEKGNEVVCREVDKVRFTTVVLDFSENFKISRFFYQLCRHVL